MNQEVGYVEDRIVIFETDIDIDLLAVLRVYDADQRERDAGPLVLLDAAIVVCAEIYDAILLMHRICLEVEARGVDVGTDDLDACMHRFFPDDSQDHRLALLVPVHLVTRLEGVHIIDRLETGSLCLTNDFIRCQTLRARGV